MTNPRLARNQRILDEHDASYLRDGDRLMIVGEHGHGPAFNSLGMVDCAQWTAAALKIWLGY